MEKLDQTNRNFRKKKSFISSIIPPCSGKKKVLLDFSLAYEQAHRMG